MANSGTSHQQASFDDEGITAYMQDVLSRIAWSEVTKVSVYKKNCYAVDQIRVVIAGKWGIVEVTEDDPDFDVLQTLLCTKLKVCSEWYQDMAASPAFETNWTVIYSNGDSA